MITPGLWRRALRQGANVRLLAIWLVGLAIPAAAVLLPLQSILGAALDHSTRAKQLVALLDAPALIDLLQLLGSAESGSTLRPALSVMGLLALLVGPLLAAAAVALARAGEPLRFHELLRGAGEHYGRMLRLSLVALLPLGIAAAAAAGAYAIANKRAARVLTEASANAGLRGALAVTLLFVFVAQVTLDLARGTFAAQPERRSALFAWWHGVRVLCRRPLLALGMGLAGLAVSGVLAALLVFLRQQIPQRSGVTVALALVLSQLALAAIGWGRASRIIGFAELVRADAADRVRAAAAVQVVPVERLESVAIANPAPLAVEAAAGQNERAAEGDEGKGAPKSGAV